MNRSTMPPVRPVGTGGNGKHTSRDNPWHVRSEDLANWCHRRLVIRKDTFGRYYTADDGSIRQTTEKRPISFADLIRHFKATAADHVCGAHTTIWTPDGCLSSSVTIDIDNHADGEAPEANTTAAMKWLADAQTIGFNPLLIDSNGNGGYKLTILFDDERVPTDEARRFGLWLIRDWVELGLSGKPEVFPKQLVINPPGTGDLDFGSWVRLPGRHHKQDHWTRVWRNGWLEGDDAIDALLAADGDPARLIPQEAKTFDDDPDPEPEPSTAETRKVWASCSDDAYLGRRVIPYVNTLDPAISGQRGHDRAFRAACKIAEFIGNRQLAEQLFRDHYNPRCKPPWSDAEIRHKFDGAFAKVQDPGWRAREDTHAFGAKSKSKRTKTEGSSNGKPPRDDGAAAAPKAERPQIEISTERDQVLGAAVEAIAADPDIYQRGEMLVRVVYETDDEVTLPGGIEIKRAAGSPRISSLEDALLACRITRFAEFYAVRVDRHGEEHSVPAHPPDWLVRGILASGQWPGIRKVEFVSLSPFVRPDGTIVGNGYDRETRTLVHSTISPDVPSNPTHEQVSEAVGKLLRVVDQFPFKSIDDSATWLCAVLTAVQRAAIRGPVPGTAFIANAAGVGKSLLADLVGHIAYGTSVPTCCYPEDNTEARKAATTFVLSGKPIVLFDNLGEGMTYGSTVLDKYLTDTMITDRLMGTMREVTIPSRAQWMVTGNNIVPAKDSFRRWLVCRLQTKLETPYEREDIEIDNIRQHALDNRREYLSAALTILVAFAKAGRPRETKAPLGTFEEWDRQIRSAVIFAMGCDPAKTMKEVAKAAPERQNKAALIDAWRMLPFGEASDPDNTSEAGHTAEQAITLADSGEEWKPLRDILCRFSRDTKLPSSKSLGKTISGIEGTNFGGYCFQKRPGPNHSTVWFVSGV